MDLVASGVGDTVNWRGLLVARRRRLSKRLGWVPFADPIHVSLAFGVPPGAPAVAGGARDVGDLVERRLESAVAQTQRSPRAQLPG